MLEVIEVRDGNFEISDLFADQDRKQIIFYKQLLQGGAALLLILFLLIVRLANSPFLIIFVVLSFVTLIGISFYFVYKLYISLTEDISGFVLIFNSEKEVNAMRVRKWTKGKFHDYIEEEIRFNQAIGFQAIIDEDGDILIEIIVDPDYPGEAIFKTYDIATVAELILLFQKAMPKLDKWFYKTSNKDEWSSELKIELNQEIQLARVPWLIRKYYGF
ncbi:MAG: hypothetical protein ACW99A_06550 [Candidatus Kariarchaeaceae archaeon]|jgi:hypothetical protein